MQRGHPHVRFERRPRLAFGLCGAVKFTFIKFTSAYHYAHGTGFHITYHKSALQARGGFGRIFGGSFFLVGLGNFGFGIIWIKLNPQSFGYLFIKIIKPLIHGFLGHALLFDIQSSINVQAGFPKYIHAVLRFQNAAHVFNKITSRFVFISHGGFNG